MKELFETVCELEQEKVEKEVKDVKLQIRRAAEFLQNSFPGGAEVVLFEANLARSPALRSFLIEKSMDANDKLPLCKEENGSEKPISGEK